MSQNPYIQSEIRDTPEIHDTLVVALPLSQQISVRYLKVPVGWQNAGKLKRVGECTLMMNLLTQLKE
jgi:hypothetical protein